MAGTLAAVNYKGMCITSQGEEAAKAHSAHARPDPGWLAALGLNTQT